MISENPKKFVKQRTTCIELIGKRSVNYKRNAAAKVTETVFKIVVEVDPMYESELIKKNNATDE